MKSINADERIAVHFVESDIRRDGRLIDLSQRTPSLLVLRNSHDTASVSSITEVIP
jgi:hypothetical protein